LKFIARGDLSGAEWSMHIIDTGAILRVFLRQLTTTLILLECLVIISTLLRFLQLLLHFVAELHNLAEYSF
jgi:hypothetical protein